MTTQLITRLDPQLKNRFSRAVKSKGLSMNYVMTTFVETFAKNPDILQSRLDEARFDAVWTSPEMLTQLEDFSRALTKKLAQ